MTNKKHKIQKTAEQTLAELGIRLEYGVGEYRGRAVRYLEDSGILQIGDTEFDRWANSVEFEFDLMSKKGQREFLRWAIPEDFT
jgi:hypothetical protein